jgi:hypothetical protein
MIRTGSGGVKAWGGAFTSASPSSYDAGAALPMTQACKKMGILAVGALIFAGVAHGAELTGTWKGELGLLRLKTVGSRVVGTYQSGGPCEFERDQAVLEGELEGNVLVGRLTVCQTGTACADHTYPLLAFYDGERQALAGHIRLQAGCVSPGLEGRRLLLRPSMEPTEPLDHADTLTASELATRREVAPNPKLARRAFSAALTAFSRGDYPRAKEQLELGLRHDDSNWAGYIQLGVVLMKLGKPPQAIAAYQRAAALRPSDPIPHYNLACAHARLKDRTRALEHLRLAVKNGFSEAEIMAGDPDLEVLKDEPEFKRLVGKAEELRGRSSRGGR